MDNKTEFTVDRFCKSAVYNEAGFVRTGSNTSVYDIDPRWTWIDLICYTLSIYLDANGPSDLKPAD